MGEVETPKKLKPSIFKKEIKLGWFFKFLLISGSIFSIVLLGGIIWVNISNNRNESLKLQKEINELKYSSGSKNEVQTSSSQLQQQAVPQSPVIVQDSDPVIDCKSDKCGTRKIKRSACSLSVCCEIGDDYVWTNSELECRNAQDVAYEKERALEKEQSESEYFIESSKLYYECLDRAKETRDSCYKGCSNIYKDDSLKAMGCQVDTCDPVYSDAFEYCK